MDGNRCCEVRNHAGELVSYYVECPGCQSEPDGTSGHEFFVRMANGSAGWSFNGDFRRPTFSPSLKATARYPSGERICHSFVRDGKIQFLDDCTHALRGQTVDLPEVDP